MRQRGGGTASGLHSDRDRGKVDTDSLLRFHSRISEYLSVSAVLNENDSSPSHAHTLTHTPKLSIHASHTNTHIHALICKHGGMKEFASYLVKYL